MQLEDAESFSEWLKHRLLELERSGIIREDAISLAVEEWDNGIDVES